MSAFLEPYYDRIGGDGDLGALLGDLQINRAAGSPLDPAWTDWLLAAEEILERQHLPASEE